MHKIHKAQRRDHYDGIPKTHFFWILFFSDLKILKALKYSFIADFAYGQKGKKVTSFSSGVEAWARATWEMANACLLMLTVSGRYNIVST